MSASGPRSSGGERPTPDEEPAASFLDAREEWRRGAPEPATGEPVVARTPHVDAPPRPAAPRVDDAVAPARRRGRGHVRGVARSVQLRTAGTTTDPSQVLSFRVDQYDAAGNRLAPVGVELHWYRSGQVSDGEEVEVSGRWTSGTLRADRVVNLTTGAQVKGTLRWPRRLWKTLVAMLVCGVAIAFFAVVAVVMMSMGQGR